MWRTIYQSVPAAVFVAVAVFHDRLPIVALVVLPCQTLTTDISRGVLSAVSAVRSPVLAQRSVFAGNAVLLLPPLAPWMVSTFLPVDYTGGVTVLRWYVIAAVVVPIVAFLGSVVIAAASGSQTVKMWREHHDRVLERLVALDEPAVQRPLATITPSPR